MSLGFKAVKVTVEGNTWAGRVDDRFWNLLKVMISEFGGSVQCVYISQGG